MADAPGRPPAVTTLARAAELLDFGNEREVREFCRLVLRRTHGLPAELAADLVDEMTLVLDTRELGIIVDAGDDVRRGVLAVAERIDRARAESLH